MLRKMQNRTGKIFFLLLCMVVALGIILRPLNVNAAWIDRSSSGIYYESTGGSGIGQGIGDMESDDMPEEIEADEGENFLIELIEKIVLGFLTGIVLLLFSLVDTLGASLDTLIYGRLVTENTLYTFDLGLNNIYGIVGSAVYGVMVTVAVLLLIPIFMGKVTIGAWRRGDRAKLSLQESISSFVLALLLLVLMPNILDVAIFLRDGILYLIGTDAATSLFGTSNSMSFISILAATATEDLLSCVIFLAAIILNLYFMIGYFGVALTMTTNYILFPFVVLRMTFDRESLKNWVFEMISCLFVPIIDALLIMMPAFIGAYASELSSMNDGTIAIIQLIFCFLIVPARTQARNALGMRTSVVESSGLAAATFLGMVVGRNIKDKFSESRAVRKNAQADRERASYEEDMAKLEKEKEEEAFAAKRRQKDSESKVPTADEIKQKAEGKDGDAVIDDFPDGLKKASPLGNEQTYKDALEAHIASEEEELANVPLPEEAALSPEERMKNAKRLEQNEKELSEAEEKRARLQEAKNEILNDESLTTEEKAQRLSELDKSIREQDGNIEELSKERETLMSIDDKIRAANRYRSQLQDEYESVANNPEIQPDEKEKKLNSLNNQIKEVENEIDGYQRQKQRIHLENEKEALAKEPATLRNEFASLQDAKEELHQEREALVRERNSLREEQANFAVGTKEHEKLGANIQRLNEQISSKDQAISDNIIQQNTISDALRKQEAGLYDRQAYNLNERVKAQEAYDKAKEGAEYWQQRIEQESKKPQFLQNSPTKKHLERNLENSKNEMARAEERLAQLSNEDRKISQRLQEIAPEQPPYTMEELRKAKSAQAVKKAAIQKEIADKQLQMEADKQNREEYKMQIAKLRSEAADCSYQSARIDQMMQSMDESLGGNRKSGGAAQGSMVFGSGASSVEDEYNRKRAAILERYANVDNFESPQFAGISREKRAQLYRERAIRSQRILTSRNLVGAAGAVAGAAAGIWLGSPGVISGAFIGEAVGSEMGENVAVKVLDKTATRPTDYTGKPLDFKVLADVRGNSNAEQQRIVDRVQAELRSSLETDKFQNCVTEELLNEDLIRNEVKVLFKKHNVTKENYEAKREQMIPELYKQTIASIENAEERIVKKCAGSEYAKLTDDVRKVVIRNEGKPNEEVFRTLTENIYMLEKWQPEYEEYLKDD